MKELWNAIQVAIATIGAWLGYLLGGLDGALYALITFVIIDYITGVLAGIVERKLSSAIGFKGIFKKMLIIMLVAIGHIIDTEIIGGNGIIRTAVIFFYLSNEGLSIIENAVRIGLPIPQKLINVLKELKDREMKK